MYNCIYIYKYTSINIYLYILLLSLLLTICEIISRIFFQIIMHHRFFFVSRCDFLASTRRDAPLVMVRTVLLDFGIITKIIVNTKEGNTGTHFFVRLE